MTRFNAYDFNAGEPVARWAVPLAVSALGLVLGLGFALARDSPAPLAIALAFAWAAWATR